MTAMVFALLKYGKGKERERAAFKNLDNGTLAQERETSAGHSTLSKRDAVNKSFGRASGRKLKTNIPAASSMATSSAHTPSSSSLLVPGQKPGLQPSLLQNNRTSADTITYESLLPFSKSGDEPCLQDDIGSAVGRTCSSERAGSAQVRSLFFFHSFSNRAFESDHSPFSDDEYRLLRANLFERFTNVSTVPSEAPIVRLSVSAHQSPSSFLFSRAWRAHQESGDLRLAHTSPFNKLLTAGFRSFQGINSFYLFWVIAESIKSTVHLVVWLATTYILRFHDALSKISPCTKSDLSTTLVAKGGQRQLAGI